MKKVILVPEKKRILDSMQNPLRKLNLLLLHSTLPVFNSFNVLLQTEAPMVHLLHSAMLNLYRDLLVRFVLSAVISGAKSFTRLDYHDSSLQLPQSEILIGFETNYARRENLTDTAGYKKFVSKTVLFYCRALDDMKKAMPLEDLVLKSLTFLNPNSRLSSTIHDLQTVISRFPNVVEVQDIDRLLSEFRDYQITDIYSVDNLRIDAFWHNLLQIKDLVTGQSKYRVLLILFLFHIAMLHVKGCLA